MKLSESISHVALENIEFHPWNKKRIDVETESDPKKKEKMLEERIKFDESIARSGIWDSHPLLIAKNKNENGKFWVFRGRRRIESIYRNIKRGKMPSNYKPPCIHLIDDSNPVAVREALFGDNDQAKRYTIDDRIEIIKLLIPSKRLLEATKGVKNTEGVLSEIQKLLPNWTMATIKKTLWVLRMKMAGEIPYREPDPDKIDDLNNLILSIYQLHKSKTKIAEQTMKEIHSLETELKKKTEKIDKDILSFGRAFPKGGYKAFLRYALESKKRPEFQQIKSIKGINELLE